MRQLHPLLTPLLLCLAMSCSSPEERARASIVRAETHLANGQLADAMTELRSALAEQPRDPDINFRLAELLLLQQRPADALFFFQETTRLDPSRHDALLAEAKLLFWEDPERVEDLLARALELAPQDPGVHVRLSEFALVRGDAEAARHAAAAAVELAPDAVEPQIQLGKVHQARILEQRKRTGSEADDDLFRSAIAAFEQADENGGGVVEALLERARVLSTWPGRQEQAAPAFRAALELARSRGHAEDIGRAASAAVRYARGVDPELTKEGLAAGLEMDPSNVLAWVELAQVTEQTGGDPAAVYAELLAQQPDDGDAHLAWASWLASQERADEAIAHLEETTRRGVEPVRMLDRILQLELARGRDDAAQDVAERLRTEFAGDLEARLPLARFALNRGETEVARTALRELVAARETAEGQRLLALAELRLGEPAAALAAVDRSIELERDNVAQAQRLRAEILCVSEDWTGCIDAYRALAKHAPLSLEEQLRVAEAMYRAGRHRIGRQWLDRILEEPEPPVGAVVEFARQEASRDRETAQAHVDRALASGSEDLQLLQVATGLDLAAGRADRALKRLDARLAADGGGTALVRALRAQTFFGLERYAEAEADALAAFEQAPDLPMTLSLVLHIYGAQGKTEEARKAFEAAAREGRLSARSGVLLARLYLAEGALEQARPLYERALTEIGDVAPVQNDLAFLLAEQGTDLDRALRLAEQAHAAIPDDPNVADTLGYVYLKKDLYAPALQQFDFAIQAVEAQGAEVPAVFRFHRGVALHGLERFDEAAAELEKALRSSGGVADEAAVRAQLAKARAQASAPPIP